MATKKSFKKFNKGLAPSSNNIITQNLKTIIPAEVNTYESKVNYELLGIDNESKNQLLVKEQILVNTRKGLIKGLAEESKTLFEAREIIKNKQGETNVFEDWFRELGYKKTYVYQSISIYEFFLETNSKQIFELPKSFAYGLYKEKDEFEEAEIIEIIEDQEPKNKLKEIVAKKQEEKLEEVTIEETLDELKERLRSAKWVLSERKKDLEPIKLKYEEAKEEVSLASKKVKEINQKIKKLKNN